MGSVTYWQPTFDTGWAFDVAWIRSDGVFPRVTLWSMWV